MKKLEVLQQMKTKVRNFEKRKTRGFLILDNFTQQERRFGLIYKVEALLKPFEMLCSI